MIKLTQQELTKLKPINNMVLISPLEDRSTHKIADIELKLETELTETAFQYINVINKVVAVPDKIKFGVGFSEWKTEMELKVGDTVVVNRMPIQFALNDKNYIECEGVRYFWIKYSDIYCKTVKYSDLGIKPVNGISIEQWGKEIKDYFFKPINGYILSEPIKETEGWGEYKVEKESQKSAIVKYVGTPNSEHLSRFKPESQSDYEPMDMPCQVGDLIFFKKYANVHLEEGIKQTLGGLIVIKAKDITHIKRGDMIYG